MGLTKSGKNAKQRKDERCGRECWVGEGSSTSKREKDTSIVRRVSTDTQKNKKNKKKKRKKKRKRKEKKRKKKGRDVDVDTFYILLCFSIRNQTSKIPKV